jgi:hypothetical protein
MLRADQLVQHAYKDLAADKTAVRYALPSSRTSNYSSAPGIGTPFYSRRNLTSVLYDAGQINEGQSEAQVAC